MITITLIAFLFIVGVIIAILAVAAEGMVIFPIIDIIVVVLILRLILKPLRRNK